MNAAWKNYESLRHSSSRAPPQEDANLGVSLLAGAFFGVAPAVQTARLNPEHVLRQEGRGSKGSKSQTWTLSALVVTEFALSLVLLIAAGLLLRSFQDLYNARLGYEPDNVMAMRLWLPVPNDPTTDIYGSPAREAQFIREILRTRPDRPITSLILTR